MKKSTLLTVLVICIFAVGIVFTGCNNQEDIGYIPEKTGTREPLESAAPDGSAEETVKTADPDNTFVPTDDPDKTPEPIETPKPVSRKITMTVVGDVYFSDTLYSYYKKSGVKEFLSDRIIDSMQNADLFIANHEFAVTDGGKKVSYQKYNISAPLEREKVWVDMGTDILSLANNHILDYGYNTVRNLMAELDGLGISYMGAGENNTESLVPVVKVIDGKKIAVFAATRFVPRAEWYATPTNPGLQVSYESTPYYTELLEAINKAKQKNDYVTIYVHMGVEGKNSVATFQKNIAHAYIEAGADMVIASHPHVLQGIEFYKGKPIIYSLGNFLFSKSHSDTVVLEATINEDNSTSIKLIPCSSQAYKTTDITGKQARKLLDFMQKISFDVTIDDDGNVTPNKEYIPDPADEINIGQEPETGNEPETVPEPDKMEVDANKEGEYKSITWDEAKTIMVEAENVRIIDAGTTDEYKEGHVPTAVCIPDEEIKDDISSALKDKEQIILIYGHDDVKSKEAAGKLAGMGYSRVFECGSFDKWK